jgi:large subunit ribosomal protein L24
MPYVFPIRRGVMRDVAMSARERLTQIMNTRRKHPSKTAKLRKIAEIDTWNIVKGDTVAVINKWHKDYQTQGKVLQVLRYNNRILVEGVNKHKKRDKGDPERGIKPRVFDVERSMPYSDVNLVCPVTQKPTRVYRKRLDTGEVVRMSKRSNTVIPKVGFVRSSVASQIVTESDTTEDDAWGVTWEYHSYDDPFCVYKKNNADSK